MTSARQPNKVNLLFRVLLLLVFSAITTSIATKVFAAQATLTWKAPTTYTDGTPVTNLGGYRVYTGTTSGSYLQNIDVGNVTTYTLSNLNDSTSYYFAVTAYDISGIVSEFSNQASYTTPAPPPPAKLYTLTASAGSGGLISPSGSVIISQGISQTFTMTPNSGYKIAGVTVDGVSAGAISAYTFSNVTAGHSIAATFAANTYTISASSGTGGSISPAGASIVNSGASRTYTITPATGYKIANITVDGVSAGAVSTYTFSNVTAGHSIAATFAANTYTISASSGTGGSISPAGASIVNSGASRTYTITPATGYKIANVTVDGVSAGAVSTYTFSNVTAGHSIAATFAANTYTISASSGTGGSISPAGALIVNSGASQTYAITPATGYKIASVTVDGISIGAVSTYTLSNITTNHSIAASFTAVASTVVFAVNSGGAQYKSSTGGTYLADTKYSSGSVGKTTAAISGTTDDTLYQSERYGNFSYNVPVANGNYNVTLKFAEFYFSAARNRVFNVKINGQTIISNLDLYAKVGKNVAYDVVIPVSVTNGALSIQFVSQVNNAKVSAIIVSTR